MEMPSVIPTGGGGTRIGLGFSNMFQNSMRGTQVKNH